MSFAGTSLHNRFSYQSPRAGHHFATWKNPPFLVVISPLTKKAKGDSSVKEMKDLASFVSSSRAIFPPKAKPKEKVCYSSHLFLGR